MFTGVLHELDGGYDRDYIDRVFFGKNQNELNTSDINTTIHEDTIGYTVVAELLKVDGEWKIVGIIDNY